MSHLALAAFIQPCWGKNHKVFNPRHLSNMRSIVCRLKRFNFHFVNLYIIIEQANNSMDNYYEKRFTLKWKSIHIWQDMVIKVMYCIMLEPSWYFNVCLSKMKVWIYYTFIFIHIVGIQDLMRAYDNNWWK